MQNIKHLAVSLTLEDDLHTGNGLGNHLIDAFQAKDKNGHPVISRQHFKGVLKSVAEEWQAIASHNKETADDVSLAPLFNEKRAEADNVQLIIGSFYLDEPNHTDDQYIVWSSSARGKNNDPMNRAPKDKSLRSVEYIKAGTRFKSTISLYAPKDKIATYTSLLEKLLSRVTRLGAKRHRGAGGVSLAITYPSADNSSQQPIISPQKQYRIKLTNTEPLRLPTTQLPGNIIPTDSFIASPKLRGALANAARLLGKQDLFEYLVDTQEIGQGASISNAYPIPSQDDNASMPWPQSLQISKSNSAKQALPWWVKGSDKTIIDTLNNDPEASQSLKRNKAPSYLVKKDTQNEWQYFTQEVQIHMRNKVRSRNLVKEQDDSELFSEETLPENGYFIATISIADQQIGNQLVTLMQQMQQHQVPITIGRGKAPCIITSIEAITSDTNHQPTSGQSLTLVLTSDWLIYNLNTLTPYQQLNAQLINQAYGLKLSAEQVAELETCTKSVTESKTVSQFNFASKLPSKPVKAIGAGSVIQFSASLPQPIFDQLKSAFTSKQAVGERTQQGFGRFYYYSGALSVSKYQHNADNPNITENRREADYLDIQTILKAANIQGSVSQWRDIYNNLNALSLQPNTSTEVLTKFIDDIKAQKQQGKANLIKTKGLFDEWKNQLATLEKAQQEQTKNLRASEFSLLLVKSLINQLTQQKTPSNRLDNAQGVVEHG